MSAIVRLSINVSEQDAEIAKAYVREHGGNVTDAVRRALHLLAWLEAQSKAGRRVLTEDAAGDVREVVFP